MVARRLDWSAGSATFTTVPSINAMLEPMIVAARIQGPLVVACRSHEPARIAASSQGGLAMLAIVHSPSGADGTKQLRSAEPRHRCQSDERTTHRWGQRATSGIQGALSG